MKRVAWFGIAAFLMVTVPLTLSAVRSFTSSRGTEYHYAAAGAHPVACVAVDPQKFQGFRCLIFDPEGPAKVTFTPEEISIDGRPLGFPEGKEGAILKTDGKVHFIDLEKGDLMSMDDPKDGPFPAWIPTWKKLDFGVPTEEFIRSHSTETTP